jgi:hypothetical protein
MMVLVFRLTGTIRHVMYLVHTLRYWQKRRPQKHYRSATDNFFIFGMPGPQVFVSVRLVTILRLRPIGPILPGTGSSGSIL